jgi:hypothetical protein
MVYICSHKYDLVMMNMLNDKTAKKKKIHVYRKKERENQENQANFLNLNKYLKQIIY